MSFGFSLSDIVLSYQLAFTVYDRCFTRAHGAGEYFLPHGVAEKSRDFPWQHCPLRKKLIIAFVRRHQISAIRKTDQITSRESANIGGSHFKCRQATPAPKAAVA